MNSSAYPGRISVPIDDETRQALRSLARREMRDPRYQAGILLREALERRGLLKMDSITITEDPNALKIGEPHD